MRQRTMTLCGIAALSTGIILISCSSVRAQDRTAVEKATFAGGCFWCMEPAFEKLDGVTEVASGYTGGAGQDPNYGSYAEKGHIEAIQVSYDPSRVGYAALLDVFWKQIDPTDAAGQFVDRGRQYRSAVFYHNEEQKQEALRSKEALQRSGRFTGPIVTEVLPASTFYRAEDYHQDYYKKSPIRYKFYRFNSGRDQYLHKVWGAPSRAERAGGTSGFTKPPQEELKKKLSLLQYRVTQEGATERPFDNEYWDNKREGIYVDIVSGEPLFSSLDKFDSKTGWPSFTRPIEQESIVEKEDRILFFKRTEVRSRQANSHLGHVFPDGPEPTGLRYCLNSAALRFIPREDLEKEGYGRYRELFEKAK